MTQQIVERAQRAGIIALSETAVAPTVEHFARLIASDVLGCYQTIDHGNRVEGTNNFVKAIVKRYGLDKK
jgi:hypothetical protein